MITTSNFLSHTIAKIDLQQIYEYLPTCYVIYELISQLLVIISITILLSVLDNIVAFILFQLLFKTVLIVYREMLGCCADTFYHNNNNNNNSNWNLMSNWHRSYASRCRRPSLQYITLYHSVVWTAAAYGVILFLCTRTDCSPCFYHL